MRVIGSGPAGATAAIAARREGAAVQLFEKRLFPRHKVCGEFLSPGAALVFERLSIYAAFLELKPHVVREANLTIGRAKKHWKLEEPAFGISRFALDAFLAREADLAGAENVREAISDVSGPVVIATGLHKSAPAGNRHFGFKAHFAGPTTDSIDLFFERGMYVGVNSIEGGKTNVCGLAPEELLRDFAFKPDDLTASFPALSERLHPLSRSMEWMITGPLVYGGSFAAASPEDVYVAGDALGFVDPFTGSGMLGAITTGYLAGRACARGTLASRYRLECREVLQSQYRAALMLRKLVSWGVAEKCSWLIPGESLFRMTRPVLRF